MLPERKIYAERAVLAYQAMLGRFRRSDGMYRYDEGLGLVRQRAQLWPFSRALMATLDVAGIADQETTGVDIESEVTKHLETLERYWDPSGAYGAYCSDVRGPTRRGDRYYDDNAWVGLALIELERLRPGAGWLERARELFQFAAHGWDPRRGGVFWVEQGRGTGNHNHDRNVVSTAPNAELGLHLAELRGGGGGKRGEGERAAGEQPGPGEMYRWVLATLDESRGGASLGTGLFWDKVRGDGTIDKTMWSYNQGSMIGLNVLLARAASDEHERYLGLAEAIAWKALRRFAGALEQQPASFNAILFRNLLLLHAASQDRVLGSEIISAMTRYADAAWLEARDGRSLFRLRGRPTLLDQSAMVQVLALLAWKPEQYSRLA